MKKLLMGLLVLVSSIALSVEKHPVLFSWYYPDSTQASSTKDIYYTLLLSLDSLGTQVIFVDSMIPDRYNGAVRTFPDTTYYFQTDASAWKYNTWVWFKVNARYADGVARSPWTETWKFMVLSPDILQSALPQMVSVYPNPLPHRDSTLTISCVVLSSDVTLTVYDMIGNIKTMFGLEGMMLDRVSFMITDYDPGQYMFIVKSGRTNLVGSFVVK